MSNTPPAKLSAVVAALRPEAIEAEICRRSFYEFFIRAWHVIEPGTPLRLGFHVKVLCDALQAVAEGRCSRLIINIPPRHTKSKIASVAFPAWLWLWRPTTKILTASHSKELAEEIGGDCLALVQSRWYQERFPECTLRSKRPAVKVFRNISGGYRRALSAEAKVTGFGGDFLIGDDVQDAEKARKQPGHLEDTYQWWQSSFARRLNDREKGALGGVVLVMQRLDPADLTAKLLEVGGWTRLCLPAEYDPVLAPPPDAPEWMRDPRTERGQPLWWSREATAEARRELADDHVWSAQYQQTPLPRGGMILDPSKFRVIKRSELPEFFATFTSWDTAATANETSDPTGAVVMGLSREKGKEGLFITRLLQEKLTYPQLLKRLPAVAEDCPPGAVHLIESKSSGISLFQQLEAETLLPLIAINPDPDGGKEARAQLAATFVNKGLVWIVEELDDRPEFLKTAALFPARKPRDTVDAAIQGILYCCRRFRFDSPPPDTSFEVIGGAEKRLPLAATRRGVDFFADDD